MELSKAQQKRINAICKKYQRDMQKLIDKPGSEITGISLQVGDNSPIVVAKREDKDNG